MPKLIKPIVSEIDFLYGERAREHRRKFNIPIIAIGGSNGKTTTKEMIRDVLRYKYNVLANEGNMNNHIGAPSTILQLNDTHEIAVVELGTNHFGELKYLCDIIEPTHVLITNIGKEHLEFFDNQDGVTLEETELYRYAIRTGGMAFINTDDAVLKGMKNLLENTVTYGEYSYNDYCVMNVKSNAFAQCSFDVLPKNGLETSYIDLSVYGKHNVNNALAAFAVGRTFNVSINDIKCALNLFLPYEMRLNIIERSGLYIIDDTYNSNPSSVVVALNTLKDFIIGGKKYVILGDMLELGQHTAKEHMSMSSLLASMKFDGVFTLGNHSRYMQMEFNSNKHFEDKDKLVSVVNRLIKEGDVILVKGSRGMKMEYIVNKLQINTETTHETE